jgi:hypothetical protein
MFISKVCKRINSDVNVCMTTDCCLAFALLNYSLDHLEFAEGGIISARLEQPAGPSLW